MSKIFTAQVKCMGKWHMYFLLVGKEIRDTMTEPYITKRHNANGRTLTVEFEFEPYIIYGRTLTTPMMKDMIETIIYDLNLNQFLTSYNPPLNLSQISSKLAGGRGFVRMSAS